MEPTPTTQDVQKQIDSINASIQALQNAIVRFGARVAKVNARVETLEQRPWP